MALDQEPLLEALAVSRALSGCQTCRSECADHSRPAQRQQLQLALATAKGPQERWAALMVVPVPDQLYSGRAESGGQSLQTQSVYPRLLGGRRPLSTDQDRVRCCCTPAELQRGLLSS